MKDSECVLEKAFTKKDGTSHKLLSGILRSRPISNPALDSINSTRLLGHVAAEVERKCVDCLHLRALSLPPLSLRDDERVVTLCKIRSVQ